MSKKTFLLVFLISLLSLGILVPAYGEESLIDSVPLSISWDRAPKARDLVGEVYATSSNKHFVVEGASYVKRDDTWVFGERPVVEIELSAKSGYGDGNSLILQVTLPTIDSILPASTAVSWNNNTAVWDEVEGSKSYEIQLYKDNRLMATVTAKHDRYDFKSYINVEGVYTFRVRAFGTYKSQASPWSELSEENKIRPEDAWYIDNGSWERNRLGRRYVYKNKAYPTNTWRCINNKWYYFNYEGYMLTNCYIKSGEMNFYYWLGANGAWDSDKDTFNPDLSKYTIVKQ